MNVLIYSGPDASHPSLTDSLTSLRSLLGSNYAVQTVTSQSLSSHPWSASCSLLVLPSFGIPTTTMSSSSPPTISSGSTLTPAAAKEVQNYVAGGGRLLALGNGIRVHTRRATASLSLSAQLSGVSLSNGSPAGAQAMSKLTTEDPDSRLSFSLSPAQANHTESAATAIESVDGTRIDGVVHAGEVDLSEVLDTDAQGIKRLAHLSSDISSAVGIQARIGRGTAVFWSVHLESPLPNDEDERERLKLLSQTLQELELRLPSQEDPAGSPARPTPQILSAAPWRAGVVERILSDLGVPELTDPYELKDSNDNFLLHPHADASRFVADQRDTARGASTDPATWNPKHVVVYTGGALPQPALTPRFDISRYHDELAAARKERGLPDNYPEGQWGAGEALLYGEVVTSTQTMLDKNNRLLTTLPTPLLSLASVQLTGRGRGANVWLSPPGCLQFSLLLRVPLASLPAPKIVFVQYLFALAVAEACRAPGVLGTGAGAGARVRIKWPNDLYAEMPDGGQRKLGGILVNTSFGVGKVEIVIGCGLNVLNPPPIPSLAQLLPDSSAPPTMERTLAAIMARFERMWAEFVRERGSFAPFMDLYHERWLHSDQLVTLSTVTPARKVRIVGITPDHGLLRTLPERVSPWTGGVGEEYIDLQPDGNSFDLMAGLIKTKT